MRGQTHHRATEDLEEDEGQRVNSTWDHFLEIKDCGMDARKRKSPDDLGTDGGLIEKSEKDERDEVRLLLLKGKKKGLRILRSSLLSKTQLFE